MSTQPSSLAIYYKDFYPFQPLEAWLGQPFVNREISYTLNGNVMVRHRSFANWQQMREVIAALVPVRFEIGPRYATSLAHYDQLGTCGGGTDMLELQARELVFDIDMDAYDDVRCCECVAPAAAADSTSTSSKNSLCLRCWPLITAAIAIADTALRDAFGFRRLLWVFSGRRGVHCWVSDAAALRMSMIQRRKCMEFLNLSLGTTTTTVRRVKLPERTLAPHERRAYALALPHFLHYADEQALFSGVEHYRRVLALLPCPNTRNFLHARWSSSGSVAATTTTAERWAQLCAAVTRDAAQYPEYTAHPHVIEEIVLTFVYPRFDINVTLSLNHLLKAPFVVHPSTRRICVPIDATRAAEFNPLLVPTLEQVVGGERSLDDDIVRFIEITMKK